VDRPGIMPKIRLEVLFFDPDDDPDDDDDDDDEEPPKLIPCD